MANMLKVNIAPKCNGVISSYEIGIPILKNELVLPCGISARIDFDE